MDRLLWAVGPLAGIVFLAAACGEVEYLCDVHRDQMTGNITVNN